jgi:hypothetical protein
VAGGSICNSSTPHRAVRAAYNSIDSIASTGIGPNPTNLSVVSVVSLGKFMWGRHLTSVAQLTGAVVETPRLSNNLLSFAVSHSGVSHAHRIACGNLKVSATISMAHCYWQLKSKLTCQILGAAEVG